MKTSFKTILGCLSLLFLAACDDGKENILPPEPEEEPTLEIISEIPSNVFNFTASGNKAETLEFTTNKDWQIEVTYLDENEQPSIEAQDWVTVFNREGKAGESIKVYVGAAKNEGYESRSAQFTLKAGTLSETYTIHQAQLNAVVITNEDSYTDLTNKEQVISVEFGTNMGDYTYETKNTWIEQAEAPAAKTRALVSHTLYFKVAANETFTTRSGSISIIAKNDESVKAVLSVVQRGMEKPVITLKNEAKFKDLRAAGKQTITLEYDATNITESRQLELIVEQSKPEWVTVATTPNDETHLNTYELTIAANEAGSRTATAILRSTIDETIMQEFTISQQKAADVNIWISNKDDFQTALTSAGGSTLLTYETEEEVENAANEIIAEVVDDEGKVVDWLHIGSMANKGKIVLTYDKNKMMKGRSANVSIALKGTEDKKDIVTIAQNAATEVEISKEGYASIQAALDANSLQANEVTKLVLKGILSKEDLKLLKNMATSGALTHLDMTEVSSTSEFDVCSPGQGGNYSDGQFIRCAKLTYVATPKDLKEIERNFFRHCTNLKTIVINEGTEIIHRHAFGNTSATEVWFPSTIKNVYGYIFDNVVLANLRLHLKGKPFQWRGIVRDPDQPRNASSVFAGDNLPGKVYVPADYVSMYKNPAATDVVSSIPEINDLIQNCITDATKWNASIGGSVTDFIVTINLTPKALFAWMRGTSAAEAEPAN